MDEIRQAEEADGISVGMADHDGAKPQHSSLLAYSGGTETSRSQATTQRALETSLRHVDADADAACDQAGVSGRARAGARRFGGGAAVSSAVVQTVLCL